VDLRAGLDKCGKSRPTGIRSPDRTARSSVAIRTDLPGPQITTETYIKITDSAVKTSAREAACYETDTKLCQNDSRCSEQVCHYLILHRT